jgi:stage V sporulation protein SpoVS
MTVNMLTLPEPQSGAKRPKLNTQKRRICHTAIYQTIKALAILRCLYGSEMVLLGVVIGKCEMPSTNISQENDHAIIIVKRQFVACNFR